VSYIAALFVDPKWQRMGFGKLITREFEKIARQRNLTKLELSSTLNAVPFYRRLGFESIAKIPYNHPSGFSLPSVRMVKRLNDSENRNEQNDAFKPDLHGFPDGQQLGSG
jgi:ribosomal protein S18 acetylase RimI-like enzyme